MQLFYLLLLGRGGGWLACFIFSRVTPWGVTSWAFIRKYVILGIYKGKV